MLMNCFSVGRPKHVRVMAGALEGDIFIGPKAEVIFWILNVYIHFCCSWLIHEVVLLVGWLFYVCLCEAKNLSVTDITTIGEHLVFALLRLEDC
jgi:hypothetical protein